MAVSTSIDLSVSEQAKWLINYPPGSVFITLLLVHHLHRLIPHFLQCSLKKKVKKRKSNRVDYWLPPSRWWDTAVIVIIPCKLYTCSQNNQWLAALYIHCWGVVSLLYCWFLMFTRLVFISCKILFQNWYLCVPAWYTCLWGLFLKHFNCAVASYLTYYCLLFHYNLRKWVWGGFSFFLWVFPTTKQLTSSAFTVVVLYLLVHSDE